MIKTKNYQMAIGRIFIFVFAISYGCSNNSSTGPGSSQVSGKGSDYFPLTGNQTVSGKVTYQEVVYDSTGKVRESYAATNQDVHGYIGLAVFIDGLQGYPLYGYAKDGKTLVPSNVVAAEDSQTVVLFTQAGQNVILLPKNLDVGTKWIANPFSPVNQQVTLKVTDSQSSYNNSAGKTYSNVIKVNAAYSDSVTTPHNESYYSNTYWYSWHETSFAKITADVDIYFAKGVGLVDVKVNQYDGIFRYSIVDSNYSIYRNPPLQVSYYKDYTRTVISATCGRTDSPTGNIAGKGAQNSLYGVNVEKAPKKINLMDILFGKHKVLPQSLHMRQ